MTDKFEVNDLTTLNVTRMGQTARSRWRYKDLTLLEGKGEVARLEEQFSESLEAEGHVV